LGRIYIRKKELDKATGIFRALVELEPDDAAARQILASIYYSRDMADEALDEINKAIAIDPKNGDLYLAKAAIHEKTDDLPETLLAYKEAVEVFQEGKKTLPEKVSEAVARYQLGRFYLRTGLLFDALQEFKKTLELWPDSPDAHIELARTYYFLGLNDRAISVILDSPLNPILWGPLPYEDDRISKKDKMDICDILGRAFLRKEDYINSLKYFNMARTLGAKYNPSLVDYIHELAKISWKDVKERYKAGDQVEGTVKTVTNYGVIIELEENVDGLVSVSDVSWTKRVKHPGDIFKEGKKTEAVVLDVDEEKSKITLGIKQLSLDPWNEMKERYAPGTVHSGRITEITDLGVYVELEKELEGFLHRSKMKLEPSKSLKDSYRIGDALEVEVINIDDIKRRITLEQK
jgi:predicted RNA-binding protein with RPS1 domain